ncbi:hypothetical protein H6F77_05390 [Microcoleus sp. FACHB-831]|uniref:hypothetical protein n=1 Tax=Microcoleus sp. FACHB-831 TaxID=2692827 RepID=UPI0016883074|nr:hypothetical protein [Microcoleus sp. FACHB-831]MBD1920521.1 hypothetical protein [Microcoleus sp. FACHB-831]
MLVQDKRNARIAKSASNKDLVLSRDNFTGLNVESLKGSLSYFSYLHAKGEISDKTFEYLVRYACSIFIENEVEERVQDALERKLMQFWRSKLCILLESDISEMEASVYKADFSRILRSR